MLCEDRFGLVAARLEELLRGSMCRRFERHLMAVVVVRERLGTLEQTAADAQAPLLRRDDERVDVGERRRDAQTEDGDDCLVLRRGEFMPLTQSAAAKRLFELYVDAAASSGTDRRTCSSP